MSDSTKRARGFATLTPERRKEIASSGGKKAQEHGRAHRWTTDEARAQGHRGGSAKHKPRAHKKSKWVCAHVSTYQGTTLPDGYCARCGEGPYAVKDTGTNETHASAGKKEVG